LRFQLHKALIALLAVAGCGSSNSKPEPSVDAAVVDAAVKDASQKTDLDNPAIKFDVFRFTDTKALSPDTGESSSPDTARPTPDTAVGPTPDAFVPGAVVPMTVNSGNTASFNLADGAWKVFSFDTVQGHFYLFGVLPEGVDAYVGQSPSVSPFEYIEKTNYQRALTFTSNSTGKYYAAIAANGSSVSGSFQIADGGDLLEVGEGGDSGSGENKVDLTAPKGEATYFYYFAVAPGHGYNVSVTGTAKNPVTLGLSPLADRSKTGEFEFPLSSKTSVLPIEKEFIPYDSVAKSSSRLYFVSVKVKETVSLTIKVDLAS
jgi:hypothetical protein